MFAVRPNGEAVDWLATECKKLRKNNVALPFPYAALMKWIPKYADNLRSKVSVLRCTLVVRGGIRFLSEDESCDDGIMSMALWQLSFDKMALGAAMVQSGGAVLLMCIARARFCYAEY